MTKKRAHFSVVGEPGEELELAVLNLEDLGSRCLRLDDGSIVIYRGRDDADAVPGTLVTVRVKDRGTKSGLPYVTGKLIRSRIDVTRLGRPPLALDARTAVDLDRKAYSIERAAPRLPTGEDPMYILGGLSPKRQVGDRVAWLMVMLKVDVRSIEAHAGLGDLILDDHPADARLHFEIGARIGEQAIGPGFTGCLPWRFYENQAFLHCLKALGMCHVLLEDFDSARVSLERAEVLDPDDGQGVGKMLALIRTRGSPGMDADEAEEEEPEPKRPVRAGVPPVDLSEFITAFETNVPGFDWFIDLETGGVIQAQEGDDEVLPMPLDEMRESERFVLVEPDGSHEAYEDMQEFALDCDDERLRKRLLGALEGKGAFRRFKDVLLDHPAERQKWFALEDERLAARARRWLEDEGIPYVENKKAEA